MNKKLKIALSGLGLAGVVAIPVAVVACGSTSIELTAEDRELLQNTQADNWGSEKWKPSLMDLIEGKTISYKKTDGSVVSADTYAFFLGTTACQYCNNLLTGSETRTDYSKKQDPNSYTGAYSFAVQQLQSNKTIQQAFIWEDLAGGFEGDYLPWKTPRDNETSAKTFRAVEKYYQINYRSPLIVVVVKNVVSLIPSTDIGGDTPKEKIIDVITKKITG